MHHARVCFVLILAYAQGHFPTAFTEHFPVVHAAKYELGVRVTLAVGVEVEHANLPKYGMHWHKEPMEGIWDQWLQPYLGKQLDDPGLKETQPPQFWVDENDEPSATAIESDPLDHV